MRRLPAEVLLDALNQATGTTENMDMKYHHWPETIKTVKCHSCQEQPFVVFMLETYGRPKRNSAVQCDCERDGNASVLQVLTLANHPRVWEKIKRSAGRVARIAKERRAPTSKIEELFLATLGRLPTDAERAGVPEVMKNADIAREGIARCAVEPGEYTGVSAAAASARRYRA